MSKELKFRAWHKTEKRWATHNELLSEIPVSATVKEKVLTVGGEDWELVLYTGLKDKAGVEIYKGSIVKVTGLNDSTGVVVFVGCKFTIEVQTRYSKHYVDLTSKQKYDDGKSNFDYNVTFEVIGNIYEHPHLLEV